MGLLNNPSGFGIHIAAAIHTWPLLPKKPPHYKCYFVSKKELDAASWVLRGVAEKV